MNISIFKISNNNICSFGNSVRKSEVQIRPNNNDFSFPSNADSIQLCEILERKKKESEFFDNFLQRPGRVTQEEYQDILKSHPTALYKVYEYATGMYHGKTEPENLAEIALNVNEFLKRNDNFRIISVGTSPAALAEQLETLGNEVLYLPVSGVGETNEMFEMPFLKTALNYLNYQNIDNNKLNIVLDYVSTGTTLKTIVRNIQKYNNIKPNKLSFFSLANLLDLAFRNNPASRSKKNFMQDVDTSNIGCIGNIPHFPVTDNARLIYIEKEHSVRPYFKSQREVFDEFDRFSKPLARAFSLCTMNEVRKMQEKGV